MKKNLIYALVFAGIVTFGLGAYAAIEVDKKGLPVGVSDEINFTGRSGINWNFDGFNINITGINWTDAKVLDASYGSHSGINWTSFGV